MNAASQKARVYLDWNATAPLLPEARQAMLAAFDLAGNPSSPHGEGRKARALIEASRERVAAAFGAAARQVTFTSGATEAANWVLTPAIATGRQHAPVDALLVGATEHACVLTGHRFAPDRVELARVDAQGLVDVAALEARVAALSGQHGAGRVMVAIQAANNETGVVQPIARIAEALKPHSAVLVCDAVQAAGRIAVPAEADIVFVSGHKIGGPKGVGAVIVRNDDLAPEPLLKGGGQEKRQRAGTENIAAIAGFAAALGCVQARQGETGTHTKSLQGQLEAGLAAIDGETVIFGAEAPRLDNTTCFAVPGVPAETALIALDMAGIAVSSGAACSSGKVASSHALAAMGIPHDLARCALRASTGPMTTARDIGIFLDAWRAFLDRRAVRAVA